MRVIVTGGAGFIGSNLVDRLIDSGYDVVVIDNEAAESNDSFHWNPLAENYKYDICDYEAIEPLFAGAKYVFHLAAESRIQPAILNPTRAAAVNVVGTCNVLQAARKHGIKRVVYSGTSSAYGLKNQPPLKEDMPKDCLNPYSVTKCAGEDLCLMYSELFGLETVVLRYFNVYGERQPTKGQYAPVIGLFQKQFYEGQALTIVGDGLQTRDFTHVQDVVRANMLAAECEHESCAGQIFNIGCGSSHSVLEIAKFIGGADVSMEFISPRPGEARHTLAEMSKTNSILNFKSEISLEEWLNVKKN